MSKIKKILITMGAVLVSCAIGITVYLCDYYKAEEIAVQCFSSANDNIKIKEFDGNFAFVPETAKAGVIFYPGGKVESKSYAPLMQELAENDILAVLVPMPANLAVFGVDKADGIAEAFPNVENWYMAGHSLGGSMAANYVAENSSDFEGLILLASYTTSDITVTDLDVLSIYGDCDGVLNIDSYNEYRKNLPDDFTEVIIKGGCHAFFGAYGKQKGDGEASITREEQLSQTAASISEFVCKD